MVRMSGETGRRGELWEDKFGLSLSIMTVGFAAVLVLVGILYPEQAGSELSEAYNYSKSTFGWWYLLVAPTITFFCVALALSRYGKIKIGREDAEPEFGFFAWIAMFFTVGVAASVLFWGVNQPVFLYGTNLFGGASDAHFAIGVTLFMATGIASVGVYILPGLIIGLIGWRTDVDWRISSMMSPLMKRSIPTPVKWLIDAFSMLAILGAVATSIGLIGYQGSVILSELFGIPSSTMVQIAIFLLIGVILIFDVRTGLEKGINYAAQTTTVLAAITVLLFFFLGPTQYIIEMVIGSIGFMGDNFFKMAFFLDAGGPVSQYQYAWTTFWWSWWIAWASFVGLFFARISRGRTIREMVLAGGGTLVVVMIAQHGIYGAVGTYLIEQGEPIADVAAEQGVAFGLTSAIEWLPFSSLIGVIVLLVFVGFLVTSVDSAAYMLGVMTNGNRSPSTNLRVGWVVVVLAVGAVAQYIGGLNTLESFTGILGLPFSVILVFMMPAVYFVCKALYNDEFEEVPMTGRSLNDVLPDTISTEVQTETLSDDD